MLNSNLKSVLKKMKIESKLRNSSKTLTSLNFIFFKMVFKSEFNMKFPRKLYNIFTFLKYLLLDLTAISPILSRQFATL